MKLRSLWCLSILAAAASTQGQEWMKHFRIGMSLGLNMKTDFKTSGTFPISGSSPGDPTNPYQDHTYDDGYVRVDDTGNADDPNTGAPVTSFWGAQRSSQVTGTTPNQSITYHGTRSFTGSGSASVDEGVNFGFDMAYGASIAKWQRVAIGLEFGFNLTPAGSTDRQALAGTTIQAVHQYDAGGTSLPTLPYNGPFASANSPVINATGRDLGDITTPATITGSRSLEAILYQFRLGPMVRWEIRPRWTLSGSVGGTFALVSADYDFDELLVFANGASTPNRGKFGSVETTYGGYGGLVLMYDTGYSWEAFLGGHYVAMKDATVAESGREAKLKLGSTIYVTAGINWTF